MRMILMLFAFIILLQTGAGDVECGGMHRHTVVRMGCLCALSTSINCSQICQKRLKEHMRLFSIQVK